MINYNTMWFYIIFSVNKSENNDNAQTNYSNNSSPFSTNNYTAWERMKIVENVYRPGDTNLILPKNKNFTS